MTANDNTPPSGESVSAERFDREEFLKEYVDGEISFVLDALRRGTVTRGHSMEDRLSAIRQARYHLELLEAVVDDQLDELEEME